MKKHLIDILKEVLPYSRICELKLADPIEGRAICQPEDSKLSKIILDHIIGMPLAVDTENISDSGITVCGLFMPHNNNISKHITALQPDDLLNEYLVDSSIMTYNIRDYIEIPTDIANILPVVHTNDTAGQCCLSYNQYKQRMDFLKIVHAKRQRLAVYILDSNNEMYGPYLVANSFGISEFNLVPVLGEVIIKFIPFFISEQRFIFDDQMSRYYLKDIKEIVYSGAIKTMKDLIVFNKTAYERIGRSIPSKDLY